jgi:hypothetical protein
LLITDREASETFRLIPRPRAWKMRGRADGSVGDE